MAASGDHFDKIEQEESENDGYIQEVSDSDGYIREIPESNGNIREASENNGSIQEVSENNGNIREVFENIGNIHKASENNGNILEASENNGNIQEASENNGNIQEASENNGKIQETSENNGNIHETSENNGNIQEASENNENMREVSENKVKISELPGREKIIREAFVARISSLLKLSEIEGIIRELYDKGEVIRELSVRDDVIQEKSESGEIQETSYSNNITRTICHGYKQHNISYKFSVLNLHKRESRAFQADFVTECFLSTSWLCEMLFQKVAEDNSACILFKLKRTDSGSDSVKVRVSLDIRDASTIALFCHPTLVSEVDSGEVVGGSLIRDFQTEDEVICFNMKLYVNIYITVDLCHFILDRDPVCPPNMSLEPLNPTQSKNLPTQSASQII